MKLDSRLIIASAASIAACSCSRTEEKPNVVFLLFDDLGYGDFGCYGQKMIETPNIDSLAAHGLLLTDMYTAAPLSSPSRCCIMTGKHSGHSQIRANSEQYEESPERGWNELFTKEIADKEGQYPMKGDTYTIAHMMRDAGYATAMVGKWGLGFPESDSTPLKMGFDYFYGYNCQGLAHSYYPTYLWENDSIVRIDNDLTMLGEPLDKGLDPYDINSYSRYTGRHYSPDLMYGKLEDFIVRNADRPFFAMWTTNVPHSAVQAPLDEVLHYVDKFGDEEPVTDGGMYLPNRYPHATYAAMITHIDTQVGMLVKKLKELGIWDNTIFIVTSDNGPASNGNSPMEYFQSGGPFRCRKGWGKSSLHEGGIRMPFIAAWGDRMAPCRSSHLLCFADLMPTFAELSSGKAPDNDGISFAPLLLGKEKRQTQHEFLYWEFPGSKGWVAVRTGNWKGIVRNVKKGNSDMELFNLEDDPQELRNVAASHPDIVSAMWDIVKDSHRLPDNDEPLFRMDINYPGN